MVGISDLIVEDEGEHDCWICPDPATAADPVVPYLVRKLHCSFWEKAHQRCIDER